MREILFKAKCVDNGEWVEGYYVCYGFTGKEPRIITGGMQMSSASVRFGTKAYVCARYFLRPGKCFKYIDQRGEDTTEHVYEVMALYPHCALLKDTRNGVRTCPGYNTLSLMLKGSETYE